MFNSTLQSQQPVCVVGDLKHVARRVGSEDQGEAGGEGAAAGGEREQRGGREAEAGQPHQLNLAWQAGRVPKSCRPALLPAAAVNSICGADNAEEPGDLEAVDGVQQQWPAASWTAGCISATAERPTGSEHCKSISGRHPQTHSAEQSLTAANAAAAAAA